MENVYKDLFLNPYLPEAEAVDKEVKEAVRLHLIPYYVRASVIAKHYQSMFQRAGFYVYLLSTLAIGAVALGILIHSIAPFSYGLEFLMLLLMVTLVFIAHSKKAHNRWIENRFLAERIRSAMFFAACGIEVSSISVPPHLGVAHGPTDWMIKVFHEIWDLVPVRKEYGPKNCPELALYIKKAWIQDQRDYHKATALRCGRKNRLLERCGLVVFILAMAAAAGHVGIGLLGENLPAFHFIEGSLTLITLTMPALGAALGGIRSHREYPRLSKRSENMRAALEDLERRFSVVETCEELEFMLRDAEELMLRECQDWLMLMRFKGVEAAA